MRKLSFILLTLVSLLVFSIAANAKDDEVLEYEITGNGTGMQGTYLISVTVITKDKKIQDSEIARCAVHGVLFRGFSSKENRQNQKPLAGSPMAESQHADFFNSFFKEDGPFAGYVSEVDGSRQIVKSGKKYRVTSVVTVNKDQLRRDLEKAGIIKGLNSAF